MMKLVGYELLKVYYIYFLIKSLIIYSLDTSYLVVLQNHALHSQKASRQSWQSFGFGLVIRSMYAGLHTC